MQDFRRTIESQYGNSPTIVQLITNMNDYIDPAANIDQFFSMVWNVDTAVGHGLDIWGRIVGVGRVLQISSTANLGFTGPSGASGDPFNQSPFYHGGPITSNYALSDDAFRALILAKALANICNATCQAINQILINLFSPMGALMFLGQAYVTDGLNMTMTYTFTAALDPVQTAIVYQSGVLPRPAGVSSTVVII